MTQSETENYGLTLEVQGHVALQATVIEALKFFDAKVFDIETSGGAINTVRHGVVDPTTEGANGDFYINTTTNFIFGPKTAGVWGAGTSIVGPAGADGADGADGAPGADGADGSDGSDGADGADGLDGTALTGTANNLTGFDASGDVTSPAGYLIDETYGGMDFSHSVTFPDGVSPFVHVQAVTLAATEDAPLSAVTAWYKDINIDPSGLGFDMGVGGLGVLADSINITHDNGNADVGTIQSTTRYVKLGLPNGSRTFSVDSLQHFQAFGDVYENVTIENSLQIYNSGLHIHPNAIMAASAYSNIFSDSNIIEVPVTGYSSFSATPQIAEIRNNSSYSGININPTITAFEGNGNFAGIGIYGTFGPQGTGSGNSAINISQNVTDATSYTAIQVNTDNVAAYAGVAASVVIQDVTVTALTPDSGYNGVNFTLVGGGTAGSEIVSGSFPSFTIQIEDGVTTGTQLQTAIQNSLALNAYVSAAVTGVGSNPQVTGGPYTMAGGENAGTIRSAYLQGDVQIDGDLSFSGGLSIGALNAFSSQPLVDGGGSPGTVHSLVSSVTIGDSETVANADVIGVNTASLMNFADNSTTTTAFLGVSALGLPAVINMGAGSTVDRVNGAIFALSLDAGASGGTIDQLNLCRALALPNGATTVNNCVGYKMDMPFGNPATNLWGVYIEPTAAHNFFGGSLIVGDTDMPTNSSVGIEVSSTTKGILNARMTTAERNALTGVNGMQVYNSDTDKFQGYAGGTWVDLH